MMDSSRWQVHGAPPPIRSQTSQCVDPLQSTAQAIGQRSRRLSTKQSIRLVGAELPWEGGETRIFFPAYDPSVPWPGGERGCAIAVGKPLVPGSPSALG